MTQELFAEQEVRSESPRLKWMRKHGYKVVYEPNWEGPNKWCAWDTNIADSPAEAASSHGPVGCQTGESEEEALQLLAIEQRVKLWNEEDLDETA